jgi:RNA polymerase sigma-70 factor (ECF subfamily)
MSDDPRPFQERLAELRSELWKLAYRLCGNGADADDLVSDTYIRATERQHQFNPGTDLGAWARTILRRLFYDGKRSPASKVVPLPLNFENMAGGGEELPVREYTREQFDAALAQLDERHRIVFLLAEVEEKSHAEIAIILGTKVGNVGRWLSEARHQLRNLLRKYDDV